MEWSVFIGRVLRLSSWLLLSILSAPAHAVFINEIHYDNTGTDIGEAVELAGAAGLDLTGWSLEFYNGNGGSSYGTFGLSGVFDDVQAGYGVLGFDINPIQNGAPDGLALVDNLGTVVQFLSYEGVITAADGPAQGMTSDDIGVEEVGVPEGYSLQLTGIGSLYEDFVWAEASAHTFGAINNGQTFFVPVLSIPRVAVPEPVSIYLLALGLLGIVIAGQRFNLNRWRPAGNASILA